MSAAIMIITVMVPRKREYAEIMANLRLMFHRIAIVPLNHRLSRNDRKIFPTSTVKS